MSNDKFKDFPDEEFLPLIEEEEDIPVPEKAASQEAFYATALSNSENPVVDFVNTRENLKALGEDPISTQVRERLARDLNLVEDEVMLRESSQVTGKKKANIISNFVSRRTIPADVDLQREYMTEAGVNATNEKEILNEVQTNAMDEHDKILESRDNIKQQITDVVNNLSSTTGQSLTDFLGSVAPFNMSSTYKAILDGLQKRGTLGEGSPSGALVLTGEALEIIKDELRKADPKEKQALAADILSIIKDNSGLLANNDMIKFYIINEVFQEVQDPTSVNNFDWDRLIENTTGILDMVMLGQLVKGAGRIIGTIGRDAPAAAAISADPSKAAKILAGSIKSEELAKAVGTTPTEVMSHAVYPKPLNYGDIRYSPANVVDEIKIIEQQVKDVVDLAEPMSINLTTQERSIASDNWAQDLNLNSRSHLYANLSEVGIEGEKIVAKAVYGLDETHGFPNGFMAQERAVELMGSSGKWDILKRRGDGFVKTKNLSGKGEFFVKVQHERFFRPEDALVFSPTDIYIGGSKAKYLGDPSSIFATWYSNAGAVSHDLGKAIEHGLYKIIDKPFVRLGDESKLKIINMLDEGSKRGVRISQPELAAREFSEKEITGINSMYGLSDALYFLNNRRYSQALDKSGMKKIVGSNWEGLGKPIKEDLSIAHVFDPSMNEVRSITPAEITQLYKEGDTLVRLAGREGTRDVKATVAISKKSDKTKIEGLPDQILNYRPGYIARYYKDEVFVDEISNIIVDGVKTENKRTIIALGNRIQASKIADKMNTTADSGVSYVARVDRKITAEERTQSMMDIDRAWGRLFFSKRGEQLRGLEGLATVDDPIDAIVRNIGTTSRSVSHEGFIQTSKQRYVNTYGDLSANKGTYPDNSRQIIGSNSLKDTKRIGKAKAVHDYISLMEGAQPVSATMWKGFVNNLADSLENGVGGFRDASATKLRNMQRDPMQLARGATFNMFLAANPLRQAILQSSQFSFIASLEPRYVLGAVKGKGFLSEKLGLDLGMASATRPELATKLNPIGAKLMGVSEKEYSGIVKDFRDSGLPFSIDSHLFVRDAVVELSKKIETSMIGKVSRHIRDIPVVALRTAKKVGFDFGEYNNLASTYLLARHRFLKRPGKSSGTLSREDKLNIGAEARQLALSMTEAGSFGYQKGAFSLMTQFYSIQQKAFLAVLPKKLGGNKFFTAQEKLRIGLGQALMYGTAGFGLKEIYESRRDFMGIEPNPVVDKALKGGLADIVLNAAITSATGDDTNLVFANDLAPASGTIKSAGELVLGIFSGGTDVAELAFGPSYDAGGRLWRAGKITKDIMVAPDLSVPEQLTRAVNSSLSVFSGYNNYLKASAAKNLGFHVNNSGDPVVKAAWSESIGQLFGFRTDAVDEYYRLQQKLHSFSGSKNNSGAADHLKDIAKQYYKRMSAIAAKFSSESPQNLDDLQMKRFDEAIRTEAIILSVLDPNDREFVLNEFRKQLSRGVEVKSDRLVNDIVRASLNGDYGNQIEGILTQLKNSGLLNTPEEQQDIRDLWDYLTGEVLFDKEGK